MHIEDARIGWSRKKRHAIDVRRSSRHRQRRRHGGAVRTRTVTDKIREKETPTPSSLIPIFSTLFLPPFHLCGKASDIKDSSVRRRPPIKAPHETNGMLSTKDAAHLGRSGLATPRWARSPSALHPPLLNTGQRTIGTGCLGQPPDGGRYGCTLPRSAGPRTARPDCFILGGHGRVEPARAARAQTRGAGTACILGEGGLAGWSENVGRRPPRRARTIRDQAALRRRGLTDCVLDSRVGGYVGRRQPEGKHVEAAEPGRVRRTRWPGQAMPHRRGLSDCALDGGVGGRVGRGSRGGSGGHAGQADFDQGEGTRGAGRRTTRCRGRIWDVLCPSSAGDRERTFSTASRVLVTKPAKRWACSSFGMPCRGPTSRCSSSGWRRPMSTPTPPSSARSLSPRRRGAAWSRTVLTQRAPSGCLSSGRRRPMSASTPAVERTVAEPSTAGHGLVENCPGPTRQPMWSAHALPSTRAANPQSARSVPSVQTRKHESRESPVCAEGSHKCVFPVYAVRADIRALM